MDVIKTYIPKRFRNKKLVNTGSGSGSTTLINSGNDISPSSFVDSDTFYSMFELVDLSGTPAIKAKHEFFSVAGVTAYGTGTVATGGSGSSVSVLDVLNSTDTGSALSANMGRVLNEGKLNRSEISSWAFGANKPAYDKTEIGGLTTALNGKSAVGHKHYISEIYDFAHVHQWGEIESKPTTLSGYGITDAFKTLRIATDLDAVTESGIYRQETPNSGFNYTTTLNLNSADGRQQLTIARDGSAMKFRGVNSESGTTGWTVWNTVYHSGNFTPGNYLQLTGGTLTGNVTAPTFIGALTGNASTATKLQTAHTIAGVSFDGTANISIPFANLSSIPTTLIGYGITDALLKSDINVQVGGTKNSQMSWTSWNNSDAYGGAIQIREYGNVNNTQSDWYYSPAITFHWGNRSVKRFGMRSDGQLAIDDSPILWSGNYSAYALPLSGGTMTGNLTMGVTTDIITNFKTWTKDSSKSLKLFLDKFDIDTAGNLVVKTNLYSTGEVTAYSSGAGVAGLKLMGDMNANGKSITGALQIYGGNAYLGNVGINPSLQWSYDGDENTMAMYNVLTGEYFYAGNQVKYLNNILTVTGQVNATEFKFGNYSFKQSANGLSICFNGVEQAYITNTGQYVNS